MWDVCLLSLLQMRHHLGAYSHSHVLYSPSPLPWEELGTGKCWELTLLSWPGGDCAACFLDRYSYLLKPRMVRADQSGCLMQNKTRSQSNDYYNFIQTKLASYLSLESLLFIIVIIISYEMSSHSAYLLQLASSPYATQLPGSQHSP